MQLKHQQMLVFLFQLIDVQIKKYVRLTQIGIGPDADMNAKLVSGEVDELSSLLGQYIKKMEDGSIDDVFFNEVYSTVKFYLDLEHLRGHAGWLLDENNIHNTLHQRVVVQQAQLAAIATTAGVDTTQEFKPVSENQLQSQHDSYEIAHLILDSAVRLIANPNADIDKKIFDHAAPIMRRHAAEGGRYHQKLIHDEIVSLHAKCTNFLKASHRAKSQEKMTTKAAKECAELDRIQFDDFISRFDKLAKPDFSSAEIKWYEMAGAKNEVPEKTKRAADRKVSYAMYSSAFFYAAATVGGVAVVAAGVGLLRMGGSSSQ